MYARAVIRAASDIIMLNQSYTITPLQCAHLCIEMIHNRPAIEKNALYFVNKTKLTCLPKNKMHTGSIYERDIHENCHPTVNLPPQKSLDLRLIPSVRKKAFEVSVNARARSLEIGGKGTTYRPKNWNGRSSWHDLDVCKFWWRYETFLFFLQKNSKGYTHGFWSKNKKSWNFHTTLLWVWSWHSASLRLLPRLVADF